MMDIAGLSTMMSFNEARGSISVAVASKVKDMVEESGENIVKMLDSAKVTTQGVSPNLGNNIDIRL